MIIIAAASPQVSAGREGSLLHTDFLQHATEAGISTKRAGSTNVSEQGSMRSQPWE